MKRVAVDVNVSNWDIGDLARAGDVIVCVADRGEDDASWLERALCLDVDIIISQDLDLPNLLDHWRVAEDVYWFESVDNYRAWRKRKGG